MEVLEVIQYAPQTDGVYEVRALVLPRRSTGTTPLDLARERSLVEYGVRQGRQMFVISWRNPEPRQGSWNFATYVRAVLDGQALAKVFAWLRPGDLVWNY